jgi:hypothetical protein
MSDVQREPLINLILPVLICPVCTYQYACTTLHFGYRWCCSERCYKEKYGMPKVHKDK